jgi:hypothetical protein
MIMLAVFAVASPRIAPVRVERLCLGGSNSAR